MSQFNMFKCQMSQINPPEIWKQHAVQLAFLTRKALTRKFQIVWVSIGKYCRRFENSWMTPLMITKVLQLGSFTMITLIKKRTFKFVGKIKATIGNKPIISISSIDSDIGVFEFLTMQVEHENVRYFSKMRNTHFYRWLWRTRGKTSLQTFKKNSSISRSENILGFLRWERISVRIRWWFHRSIVILLFPLDVPILMKTKHQST